MEFGLALQNHGDGVVPAGIMESADSAARHGWHSVWAVDHVAVGTSQAADYGSTIEALLALTWIGATHPGLKVATGVLVPPMRDAVQLAKELATLDLLTGGRLIVGVGVGDEEDFGEYMNLGKTDRFRVRGAYLDETIALWRHLWSGSKAPFEGRFNRLTDVAFGPPPPQGADLLILSGGRSDRALARVGQLTDGLYSSRWGPDDLVERWPTMIATARANARRKPFLATRVRVRFDAPADGRYSLRGTTGQMVEELVRFAELGTDVFVAVFEAIDASDIKRVTARFNR
ncbi:MAG: LLM class flavin-dependent oxidoreductase [Candidatus Limnocylindrales bacterium]